MAKIKINEPTSQANDRQAPEIIKGRWYELTTLLAANPIKTAAVNEDTKSSTKAME